MRGDKAEKVRADHCVMACYNGVIPHLVPEMFDEQRAALMYGVKICFCGDSARIAEGFNDQYTPAETS